MVIYLPVLGTGSILVYMISTFTIST